MNWEKFLKSGHTPDDGRPSLRSLSTCYKNTRPLESHRFLSMSSHAYNLIAKRLKKVLRLCVKQVPLKGIVQRIFFLKKLGILDNKGERQRRGLCDLCFPNLCCFDFPQNDSFIEDGHIVIVEELFLDDIILVVN